MIEAFYAIVIIAFASLGVVTLFSHLVHGSEIRETVAQSRRSLQELEGRIAAIRAELEDLKFDTDTMDDERVALESQTRCMLQVEERFKATQVRDADRRGSRR